MEWDEGHLYGDYPRKNDWRFSEGEAITRNIKFMCPKCYHIHHGMIRIRTVLSTQIESFNLVLSDIERISASHYVSHNDPVKLYCNICGRKRNFIQIDSGIAEVVSKLNLMGYETLYCCEGHGTDSMPYILFKDDLTDKINTKNWKYWKIAGAKNSLTGHSELKIRSNIKLFDYTTKLYLEELIDKIDEMYEEFIKKGMKE